MCLTIEIIIQTTQKNSNSNNNNNPPAKQLEEKKQQQQITKLFYTRARATLSLPHLLSALARSLACARSVRANGRVCVCEIPIGLSVALRSWKHISNMYVSNVRARSLSAVTHSLSLSLSTQQTTITDRERESARSYRKRNNRNRNRNRNCIDL